VDEFNEQFDEAEKQDKKNKSRWINKPLFGEKKPKSYYKFNKTVRNYRLDTVPRSEIYEPIRNNPYYYELKQNGADKDEILCGVNEEAIKINKVLYDCFTKADLKSNERQMFQWVLGKTTGYNKREVELNVNEIAKDIGRTSSFVRNSLNRLSKKKMIYITKTKQGHPSIYINTMVNTWC
jgi:hypothetical protein